MENIFLSDFTYPCVSYAIRRTGARVDVKTLHSMQGEKYNPDTSALNTGDIVVWENYNNRAPSVDVVLAIGEHGPVTTTIKEGRHMGVYEGDGYVSDLTFVPNSDYPAIRLRMLDDCYQPKQVIRIAGLKPEA